MKLSKLIQESRIYGGTLPQLGLTGNEEISSIVSDSRQVDENSLFIAVKGQVSDGHDYIDQAFDKGALAVIAQDNPNQRPRVIPVPDSRRSMSSIAAAFFGHPSRNLTLVGITGTNGKTTTSFLLESIFKAAGFSTGVIGTVNIRYNDKTLDNPVTTPDSIDLQKNLYQMKQDGVTHVIMEVSSHGLDLHRVDDCFFNAGIFTNLTQDHLDYHKDMTEYFECKKRFFTHLLGHQGDNRPVPAIINIDDPYGKRLESELADETVCVSTKEPSDIFATDITDDINGIDAILCYNGDKIPLKSGLTGIFNLENILCAAGAALSLSTDTGAVQAGLENCSTIPGRLEKVENAIDRHLFVDYAHTPDALSSILFTLKQRAPERLICVFGCGGDRDRAKRPKMGQAALEHSDIAIITSDNPRSENPDQIINDIAAGLDSSRQITGSTLTCTQQAKGFMIEVNRKKALEKAIFLSRPKDIIVAAGKGHETYQITNAGTIHFDDRLELGRAAEKFSRHVSPITWTDMDFENALGCKNAFGIDSKDQTFSGISTDSRSIKSDQAFLALKGENFDGHAFISNLAEKKIKAFIVNKDFWKQLAAGPKDNLLKQECLFYVCDDTLSALGKLGRYQRDRAGVKVLAITGSSGKTTTRKICEKIFSTTFSTLATTGNLNNEIGVPLTLLRLSRAHEWAVVEMGMNHPGEISRLTKIARPDVAMVLNTAGAHLEGLGSVENVARAKSEIFAGVKEGGTAILPDSDERCSIIEKAARQNENIKRFLFFGNRRGNDLFPENINADETRIEFTVTMKGTLETFTINSPGKFMVGNCLAAMLAAHAAGIGPDRIRSGLAAFSPVKGRMTITVINDQITLMDDTYNANPSSVAAALDTLKSISKEGNRIAVLGDMLELGAASEQLHRETGRRAARSGISHLFVYGSKARFMIEGAREQGLPQERIYHGEKKDIAQMVLDLCPTRTFVLVKGSRGMAMETVIEKLQELTLTASRKEGKS